MEIDWTGAKIYALGWAIAIIMGVLISWGYVTLKPLIVVNTNQRDYGPILEQRIREVDAEIAHQLSTGEVPGYDSYWGSTYTGSVPRRKIR